MKLGDPAMAIGCSTRQRRGLGAEPRLSDDNRVMNVQILEHAQSRAAEAAFTMGASYVMLRQASCVMYSKQAKLDVLA